MENYYQQGSQIEALNKAVALKEKHADIPLALFLLLETHHDAPLNEETKAMIEKLNAA